MIFFHKIVFFWFILAEKYIELLKDEGGVEVLEMVTKDPRPIDDIKMRASQVINFIKNHKPPLKLVTSAEHMNGNVVNGQDAM